MPISMVKLRYGLNSSAVTLVHFMYASTPIYMDLFAFLFKGARNAISVDYT